MHLHMEQSFPHHSTQQQNFALGWTQASVEASAAPSQSASSAVISPGTCGSAETPSNSLGQSSTSLKEHDYIGLAEVSSAPPPLNEPHREAELNFAETDLRLGLGPSEAPLEKECKDKGIPLSSHASDVTLQARDDSKFPPSVTSIWQSIPSKSLADSMAMPQAKGYQSPVQLACSKNGSKRLYTEAMVDVSRDSRSSGNANSNAKVFNSSEAKSCANPIMSMKQLQDAEAKTYSEGLFWAAPHVAAWQSQSEGRPSTYRAIASQKGLVFSSAAREGNGDAPRNPKLDLNFRGNGTKPQSFECPENVHDEAPPAKDQVVGWPPVRAYRRNTLATRTKTMGEEGDSQSNIYVKVNMDGIPIGRKVDLCVYKSYDGLLSALEDMFHNPNGGYGALFLKGSEFVLTYEDKEGDWMLVGDVPWSMFINTVRRLRITKGPEMAGPGPRTSTRHA